MLTKLPQKEFNLYIESSKFLEYRTRFLHRDQIYEDSLHQFVRLIQIFDLLYAPGS